MDKWGDNFMSKRRHLHWRASLIVSSIDSALHPKSVLDIGCATGDLIEQFLNRQIPAFGVDISPSARKFADPRIAPHIIITDFLGHYPEPIGTNIFDLVMAVEFFSVIDPWLHDRAIDNMLAVCQRWLLVCCGEDKRHGLKENILDRGLLLKEDAIDRIRSDIEPFRKKLAIKAFYNGLMVFERR